MADCRSSEQHLIDLMFEMLMRVHEGDGARWFQTASRDDVANWATKNLAQAGFKTHPQDLSWAVLDGRALI